MLYASMSYIPIFIPQRWPRHSQLVHRLADQTLSSGGPAVHKHSIALAGLPTLPEIARDTEITLRSGVLS